MFLRDKIKGLTNTSEFDLTSHFILKNVNRERFRVQQFRILTGTFTYNRSVPFTFADNHLYFSVYYYCKISEKSLASFQSSRFGYYLLNNFNVQVHTFLNITCAVKTLRFENNSFRLIYILSKSLKNPKFNFFLILFLSYCIYHSKLFWIRRTTKYS